MRVRYTLLGLALSVVFACGSDSPSGFLWANGTGHACDPDAAAVSLPAAQIESLPPLPPISQAGGDAVWAALSLHVPGGWGGAYLQGSTLVLLFVDPAAVSAGLDSLAVYGPSGGLHIPASRDSIRVLRVRWNWLQLFQWREYLEQRLTLSGVTYIDIQETSNRLEFGAMDGTAREAVVQQLASLRVPCWLAAVNIQPPAQFAGVFPSSLRTDSF